IELDAHRAALVDLRIAHGIGLGDRAQSRRLADLFVERHERKAEPEHRQHDDAELGEKHPIVLALGVGHRRAHSLGLRRCRPMPIRRNSSTALPITPIATSGPPRYTAAMMPTKNTAAMTASASPVRRF